MVLDAIVQRQRELLAIMRRDEGGLRERVVAAPAAKNFLGALQAGPRPALIAECKRRSPVKGVLREDYAVANLARAYEEGGASAISVLTSPDFDGRLDHLSEARGAVGLPLLRKDFIIDPIQLLEARASGADAVLLVVRILTSAQLDELSIEARELGLQTLVEIHAEDEFETAVEAGPDLLGVNSRDLETFEVRLGLLQAVAASLPAGLALVAESGIASRADVVAAGEAGARAVLVGETLVRSADPAAKARELLGAS